MTVRTPDSKPTEPDAVRVFVNERAVSVPRGALAIDAVHAFDQTEADAVRAGERRLTDSRGLPVPSETPVHGGAIFRVVAVRASVTDATDAAADTPAAGGA